MNGTCKNASTVAPTNSYNGETLVTLAKWSTGEEAAALEIVSVRILIKLPTVVNTSAQSAVE